MNYSQANASFDAGDYAAAGNAYAALGNYKDAPTRAKLSNALLALSEGRADEASAVLAELSDNEAASKTLADALIPVLQDWERRGLSKESALLVLERLSDVPSVDNAQLVPIRESVHTAYLDGDVLSSYSDDVDGDGKPELVALAADGAISVYRMNADGNAPMEPSDEVMAACALHFAQALAESDLNASITCYESALALAPSDDTREALAEALTKRADILAADGDRSGTIRDMERALAVNGSQERFDRCYELNLAEAQARSGSAGIQLWEDFAARMVGEFARYNAQPRWQADAAALHLELAQKLAEAGDTACMTEFQLARELGADVEDAIDAAMGHFSEGLVQAKLRQISIELADGDPDRQEALRGDLRAGVIDALSAWEDKGIDPAEVPALIRLADESGIDLTAIEGFDRQAAYESAALRAAGDPAACAFVEWDGDEYPELLLLDADRALVLQGLGDTWQTRSKLNIGFEPSALYVINDEARLVAVISADADALAVAACASGQLQPVFDETDICRCVRTEGGISFARLIAGSIDRWQNYSYAGADIDDRPVSDGIDWQQQAYPAPESAEAAMLRWLEARALDIPEEVAGLTADAAPSYWFSADALSALVLPEAPADVEIATMWSDAEKTILELSYGPEDASNRLWALAVNADGWKLAGAADRWTDAAKDISPDYSLPLLSLNGTMTRVLESKNESITYRVQVPWAGSVTLLWQAGTKAQSRDAFTISLMRDTPASAPIKSHTLRPSPSYQQALPLYLAPGVYYVTVTALTRDALPYSLTLKHTPIDNVELEPNDTIPAATPILTDTEVTASLHAKSDVDIYQFTLDAPSAVNLAFSAAGSGRKSETYRLQLASARDRTALCTLPVTGDARLSETGNVYLAAGSYLVQVKAGSAWAETAYTLTVHTVQNGTMEAENNDTPETANAISVNTDIHASTAREGDTDCYAFTLENDAVLQPKLTFMPTESSSKTYVLTLLDSARQTLMKVNIGGKESDKIIAPIALKAGSYWLKLENPTFIRQDYALRINAQSVALAEREPNGTAALATGLGIGDAVTGVLNSRDDVDYCRLALEADAEVTLSFSFAQSAAADDVYRFTIEQNGKRMWSTTVTGDSGGFSERVVFKAGEYYLRIEPAEKTLTSVYTLSIKE